MSLEREHVEIRPPWHAPGSIYRSILSSHSYCWKIFTTGASYWTTGTLCNGSRLSAFVQISALFQIYIADMSRHPHHLSRHLHHLTKCPFEVKNGLTGLFLHWKVIADKQTLVKYRAFFNQKTISTNAVWQSRSYLYELTRIYEYLRKNTRILLVFTKLKLFFKKHVNLTRDIFTLRLNHKKYE